MHALAADSGHSRWSFDVTHNAMHIDRHDVSYGYITSSAAVARIPGRGGMVFFGGGGTVYGLDARTGKSRWAVDIDPRHPRSPAEVESSPVVWRPATGAPLVLVGMDTNEADGSADGGVVALDARTGALRWKYDADVNRVVHSMTVRDRSGRGCGDIWTSPALDAAAGLLFFGTGNCDLSETQDAQWVLALHVATGARAWRFEEPRANHGWDDDFGASPVVASGRGGRRLVVQAGKSGWVYGLDERTGRQVFGTHAAVGSSIGGFIGSPAAASVHGHDVLFGDTAIPMSTDGPVVDPTLAEEPTRSTSLHAVDIVTGEVLWHSPAQVAAYAPVTYAGGVVFAPDTVEFSLNAYDAVTGLPLWHLPIGAAASGGAAVVGDSVYVGTGTYFSAGAKVPPQVTGVWAFALPV
jgi:polyvinyl alcohol dehydrogenase (cytochrome)